MSPNEKFLTRPSSWIGTQEYAKISPRGEKPRIWKIAKRVWSILELVTFASLVSEHDDLMKVVREHVQSFRLHCLTRINPLKIIWKLGWCFRSILQRSTRMEMRCVFSVCVTVRTRYDFSRDKYACVSFSISSIYLNISWIKFDK